MSKIEQLQAELPFTVVERVVLPEGIPVEVALLFEKLALDVHRAGWKRFSSDAVLHRIRWYHRVDKGDREFKCNDHWTAPLARWFLARHPELPEFFETRRSPHSED